MSSSTGRPDAKAAYRDVDNMASLNQTEQTSNVLTKTDKRLLAAQQLYEDAHRLNNITSELKVCISILEDRNASQRKRDDIARDITRVILPVIVKVADVLNDTGKNIAPIGSVKVICVRNASKWTSVHKV